MRIALYFLLTASAMAQQTNSTGGNRMIFMPGAKEPVSNATPTPPPAPKRVDTPQQAMENFFLALKAGQTESGYDGLVYGTIIADRKEDVAGLKAKTMQALDNYGPISGYEIVDEKLVGESLQRFTCISLNTDLPLRWRFYFYKSTAGWRLVDLRVDDALVELFEEAGRTKK